MEGEQYMMDLLDSMLKTVVGATKFKENRCKRYHSEWFTITDAEAFLLCVLYITGNSGILNGW
jgi:hypothetical protein